MSDEQAIEQQQPAQTEQPVQAPAPKPVHEPASRADKTTGRYSARNDVAAAFDEIQAKHTEDETKKTPEVPAQQAKAPVKDPATGKFVKADQVAPVQAAPGRPEPIMAPAGWSGGGKVDWKKLPRAVQEAIASDYKSRADLEGKFSPINAVIAPREQALIAQYGGVAQALTQLFALSDYASRDPQGFIHWFTAQRGINLQQPARQQQNPGQQFAGQQPAQAASQQNIDPALVPFVSKLDGIERYLTQQQAQQLQAQQQEAAQVQQQANTEVNSFIANSEKYPYANDVRSEMAYLFSTGAVKTLDEAYEKAVYLNDGVRERMIQDRANAELDKRAAVADEKKKAGVSVTGAPGGQPTGGANRKTTVRDDVLAAARETGFLGASRL